MTEPYRGKVNDRRYSGESADITYNVKRCIHAEECIHRLSAVFDNKRRPWIDANAATVDQIADVTARCPSGALHLERRDGGAEEAVPETNRIIIWHNGPLQVSGDLVIEGAHTQVEGETRATLCRCGASKNKPFCDNAHLDIGFEVHEIEPIQAEPNPAGGKLTVKAHTNGPLEVTGHMTIVNAAGDVLFSGDNAWLCRCGGSSRKPFCDSTHKKNGFTAE